MAEPTPQQAPGAPQPDAKVFNLKPTESNLLNIIRNNQNAIFSAVLSTLAIDRLGYPVTDKTQFELNPELTEMKIKELAEVPGQPPVPEGKVAEQPAQADAKPADQLNPPKPETPDSPIATAH